MTVRQSVRSSLIASLIFAGSIPAALAAIPDAPPPGMARVWFMHPTSGATKTGYAAPMIYANNAPIATIPAGAEFYRDVVPGTYQFSVQPYGQPTGDIDTVQLTPGSQAYLEVQWAPVWEEGYAGTGPSSHSFFLLNLSPQLAQAWLPTLTNLGQD